MKIFLLFFSFYAMIGLQGQAVVSKPPQANDKIKWYTLEEAVQLNKATKKKIIIDLYTDWCGWCKVMERNTFSNSKIVNYINKKFYPVKLNAETKESINFNDKRFDYISQGQKGYNEFALMITGGRLSYPSTVFIDEDSNIIQSIPGYLDAEKFYQILNYFGENRYKDTPWEVYEKQK